MKKYLLACIIWSLANTLACAQYKNWGAGLHVGDPLGMSVKKYFDRGIALEAVIGRTAIWGYDYQKAFYRNESYNSGQYQYRQHLLHSALSFQLHYIQQKPITKGNFKGMEWYWGGGGQLRALSVDYEYRYYENAQNKENSKVQDSRLSNIAIGVDGVAGLEYSWRELPFSVFADLTLFVEVIDAPFLFYIQGGIGGRYYF